MKRSGQGCAVLKLGQVTGEKLQRGKLLVEKEEEVRLQEG